MCLFVKAFTYLIYRKIRIFTTDEKFGRNIFRKENPMINLFDGSVAFCDRISSGKYLSLKRYNGFNVIQVTDAAGDEHFIDVIDDAYLFLDGILSSHGL